MPNRKIDPAKIYEIQIQVKRMTLGLMVIALAGFVIQTVRAVRYIGGVEDLYLAVTAAAWLLIAVPAYAIRYEHGGYARIMICGILMVILTFVEFLMAYTNIAAGAQQQAFISFDVMLVSFLILLGQFYVYYHLLGAGTMYAVMQGYTRLVDKCRRKGALSYILIVICMILMPVTKLIETSYFSDGGSGKVFGFAFFGTLILGAIVVMIQAMLCIRIRQAYGLMEYAEKKTPVKEEPSRK